MLRRRPPVERLRAIPRVLALAGCGIGICIPQTLPVAQDLILRGVTADQLQKQIDSIVALTGFVILPDLTASNLSISGQSSEDTEILITQMGDGFTVSDDFPLYLEGVLGFLRYDPKFLVSDGTSETLLPLKWNTIAATAGVGWNFPITDEFSIRPMLNGTLAHVESDVSVAGRILEAETGRSLDFLQGGQMDIFGYGGSIVLDYERYRPGNEIDVELRYTHLHLENFSDDPVLKAGAEAITATVWARYREPTDMVFLDRPVRWVAEVAYSEFIGDQGDALGLDRLASIGGGLEVDLSAVNGIVSRTRLLGRVLVGNNALGFSMGIGVSF